MEFNPIILIFRFLTHLIHPFLGSRNQFNTSKHPILYLINSIVWLFLIPVKAVEIIGFSYVLNGIFRLITSTRKLTEYERQELQLIFGDSIKLSNIRIKEKSFLLKLTRQKGMGYVWMQTICFSREINCTKSSRDMAWLIHEAVHVAQFNKLGIQYVIEALIAQQIGGYDYGGVVNLKNHKLNYFNLEQQADIARDYYVALKNNRSIVEFESLSIDLEKGNF